MAAAAPTWSAAVNTDIERARLLTLNPSGSTPIDVDQPPNPDTSSGDFLADYPAACRQLGVAPHPRLAVHANILEVFGFALDLGTARALSLCLPANTTLTTVHFWNAGLSCEVLRLLSATICRPSCAITRLHIDWNPLKSEGDAGAAFASLVGPKSPLKILTLRGNQLTDAAAHPILDAVGEGGQLAALNLSTNLLGPDTATQVGLLLRGDRTLQSVSLSHNPVGDAGLVAILAAMRPFPLEPAEVKNAKKFLPRGKIPATGQACCTGNNVLRHLAVSFAQIGDQGALAAIETCKENATLARIILKNNRVITQPALEQIADANIERIVADPPRRSLIDDALEMQSDAEPSVQPT
ncbi:unnamed protein product (mitochondrion) [Plasmodiophora brassicae]|uniref:Uncharacterized protein n=1 Tax=Plasmodiophora brassicae TaxID=37360 RepID=A0A0G4II27_PLABS|nr:hypothetical protein PBRA_003647 [Plasmodiophora brassicae]SPQ94166.1 unnamed protein product [Plasmodiophora brassicae]